MADQRGSGRRGLESRGSGWLAYPAGSSVRTWNVSVETGLHSRGTAWTSFNWAKKLLGLPDEA